MFVYRLCYVLLGLSVCFVSSLKADEAKYCATTSVVALTKALRQTIVLILIRRMLTSYLN
jgi:hypothetical protein